MSVDRDVIARVWGVSVEEVKCKNCNYFEDDTHNCKLWQTSYRVASYAFCSLWDDKRKLERKETAITLKEKAKDILELKEEK